jgi:hypothetical protein
MEHIRETYVLYTGEYESGPDAASSLPGVRYGIFKELLYRFLPLDQLTGLIKKEYQDLMLPLDNLTMDVRKGVE